MQDIRVMKKSIFAVFLILAVCASASMAQTKKRTVKRTTTKTAVGKTTTKTTITTTKKMTAKTTDSAARTTASGLTYIVTKRGAGAQLKAGDNVIVNYTGLFTNGQVFDSSVGNGDPLTFKLGTGRVIKGWDEGLQLLRVGDHATFIIPAAIAYGKDGFGGGVIPPDATLVFLIEVIGVK